MPGDEQPSLRLKNGAVVDPKVAYTKWRMLTALHDRHPEEFKLLAALTDPSQSAVLRKGREYLRAQYGDWFDRDGQLKPVVQDVLHSAVRITAEGLTVVNPFHLETQQERDLFSDVQQNYERFLRDFFRRPDDTAKGR